MAKLPVSELDIPESYPAGSIEAKIMDATARCFAHSHVSKISIDDIALEANVSRTTIYRKFENKQAIVLAFLIQRARLRLRESLEVMSGSLDIFESMEAAFVHTVQRISASPGSASLFESGANKYGLELMRPIVKKFLASSIDPMLGAAQAAGELRKDLTVEEICDWLLRSFMDFVANAPWEDEQLKDQLRKFIFPALRPQGDGGKKKRKSKKYSVEERLSRIEKSLAAIQQSLASGASRR